MKVRITNPPVSNFRIANPKERVGTFGLQIRKSMEGMEASEQKHGVGTSFLIAEPEELLEVQEGITAAERQQQTTRRLPDPRASNR
ncbi:hypothetical protein H9Q13_04960 [Pontibacter sp. JH31]|uniref:Uncharacterized protein n=1 Tax=Pontibacter aquaedesilientis TaxID=2766980 RepID=A0ABR7XGH0_9BACT|nr:hypothetical protein [Pontibacter aquaedesilientis]MBD1396506.1 hypothetical protein [Pontibacter aquaedesilientis]